MRRALGPAPGRGARRKPASHAHAEVVLVRTTPRRARALPLSYRYLVPSVLHGCAGAESLEALLHGRHLQMRAGSASRHVE